MALENIAIATIRVDADIGQQIHLSLANLRVKGCVKRLDGGKKLMNIEKSRCLKFDIQYDLIYYINIV